MQLGNFASAGAEHADVESARLEQREAEVGHHFCVLSSN